MNEPLDPRDTVAVVLHKYPSAARVLMHYRMHCVGCPIAPFETLAEACEAYGVAVVELVAGIRLAAAEEAGGNP